jgi:hypothetical protein
MMIKSSDNLMIILLLNFVKWESLNLKSILVKVEVIKNTWDSSSMIKVVINIIHEFNR